MHIRDRFIFTKSKTDTHTVTKSFRKDGHLLCENCVSS